MPPLKRLPSETFFEHCVTGFEGDEAPPSRLPEFYENILAWSSDVYHHDGDDAWRAIETMRKCELAGERTRRSSWAIMRGGCTKSHTPTAIYSRPRHRDRTARLVADRGGSEGVARARRPPFRASDANSLRASAARQAKPQRTTKHDD